MQLLRLMSVGVLACGSLFCVNAVAAIVVSPVGETTTEGNTNNVLPFNIGLVGVSSARYQQVYGSSDFTSLGGPVLITQIAFRPDASQGSAFSSTLPNVQIDLSTTSAAVDGLSSTFAANVGSNDTVVHSGALSLSSSDTGPAGGPENFDIIIPLTTPFLYDPSQGNLLLDVRNFGGGTTTQFDAENLAGDAVSRTSTFFTGNANSTTSDQTDSVGLVTQFTTTSVPEPLSASILSLGGVFMLRRRSRR